MILNESTRDNMLLPYVELLQQKGIETNLGKLKTDLLRLLADNAGIHNLSLRSNFYLAGCARYYFNGDLTTDGNVGLLSGQPDNFNTEICDRLNALIVILRNAYIDTVGTQFEQPEDFGTLKLPVLLKKYNHKINLELGIEDKVKKEKAEVDNLNRDPSVGSNYSFDIIYNFNLGRKYERPTAPGSWCVTYGQSHFNNYTKHTNPLSHLVVFSQDGFENINREKDKDPSKWVRDNYSRKGLPRPHDPYANSLIAFFQSNESWKPSNWEGAPLITSRWNHGSYSDTGELEADRAYTLQEFMNITGVSEMDLQRIYEIWKKDRVKFEDKREKNTLSPEEKSARLNFLRMLKYAQMCANNGENLKSAINGLEIVSTFIGNEEKLSKSVLGCKVGENYFLINKGQIAFDTIVYNAENNPFIYICEESNTPFMNGAVIIKFGENIYSVYNFRAYRIIEVDGLNKFCSASIRGPYRGNNNTPVGTGPAPAAMLFRQRGNRSVLFSSKTGLPIKLPNGQYIFERCSFEGSSWRVTGDDIYIKPDCLLFIVYDTSARETYMFNPTTERFTSFNKNNWQDIEEIVYLGMRKYWSNNSHDFEELIIEYKESHNSPRRYRYVLFDKETGGQLNIFPGDQPYSNHSCNGIFGDFLMLSYDSKGLRKLGIPRVDNKPFVLYNYKEKSFLIDRITGKPKQFGNNVFGTKYPNLTLILIGTSPWDLNREPYLLDLDSEIKYQIPHPTRLRIYPQRLDRSTEEWFCMGSRLSEYRYLNPSHDEEVENILTSEDYAHENKQIFYRYEDVLNGHKTYGEDFDSETAYSIISNNGAEYLYEAIKITKEDIVEMVEKVCNRLLENK